MKKDIKIKNLNSLLAEAAADTELEKLVDETEVKDKDKKDEKPVETEVKEVEETPKKEESASTEEVKEDKPEEKTEEAELSKEDFDATVEQVKANPTKEVLDAIMKAYKEADIKVSDKQKAELEALVKEDKPEEKADEAEVIKEDIDVEAEATEVGTDVKATEVVKDLNKDTAAKELEGHATDDEAETGAVEVATDVKPIDSKEHNGIKLPEGTLEFKDTEKPKELEGHATDDEAETGASEIGKEVEPVSSEEHNGIQLKEGFLEFKEETEISPEVKSDEVIDTLDSAADVEPLDGEDVNGVASLELKSDIKDTTTPDVKTDDVVETEKEADDVKPVGIANDKLDEAIEALNKEFELLHEEEHETLESADDVKAVENTDELKEKSPEKKEYEVVEPLEAAGFKDDDKDDKKEDDKVREAITTKSEDKPEEKVEKPEEHKSEYKSLKEAIALGSKYFETEEEKHALEEKMSILLASENDDLLYEEYNRLLSEAAAIKDKMIHKYSIIAHNRTNNLVESMENAEAKIIANKKSMFKKLVEQQEINAAKDSAEKLSVDETVFGK